MAFVVRAGRILGPVNNYLRPVAKCRFISTSKKNDETAVVNEKMASHQDVDAAAAAAVAAKKRWVSYGISDTDEEEDVGGIHGILFVGVTVVLVMCLGFGYAYSPDRKLKDWAHREAYLTLREREAKGLPLIDPYYVEESKIVLPSDEELGDTEIII